MGEIRVARRRRRKLPMVRSILWLALRLRFCKNRFVLKIVEAVFLASKFFSDLLWPL